MFGGGAGGGKSWLGCEYLLTQCVRFPRTKWFLAREELKRIMTTSFVTWSKVCAHHGIPADMWKLNGQYNYIEFTNGSRIDLLDCKLLPTDPMYERFGSSEYTGGFMEEAGEISFMAFDVLKSRVGRHMNKEYNLLPKILITANPNKGWLHKEVYLPWKNGELRKEYKFVQALYMDNPYTAEEYGQSLNEIKNPTILKRLRDGDWQYSDDGQVFRRIKENATASEQEPLSDHTYSIGVDLARLRDWTVISVIDEQTHKQVYIDRFNQVDWNLQESRIEACARRFNNAAIRIDATGLGDAIVQSLERRGLSVKPYTLTNQSKKDLIDNLALLLEKDDLKILQHEIQIQELEAYTYEIGQTGTVKYNAPDGQHDDTVIALGLSCYQLPEKQMRVYKDILPDNELFDMQYNDFGEPIHNY